MSDIAHYYGSDLSVDASGDILAATGVTLTQQRIIRRLLTSQGVYIWQLNYGAGLGTLIGKLTAQRDIQNLVRTQIFLEDSVAKVPEPTVTVTADQSGDVIITIVYVDNETGISQSLTLPAV